MPAKADYRRYRIRQAPGGDDTACLREALRRRLARVEREPLPDLLLVHGGKGQLGVALAALSDAGFSVPAAGIAKERDDESPSPRVRRSGGLKAERILLARRKDPLIQVTGSRLEVRELRALFPANFYVGPRVALMGYAVRPDGKGFLANSAGDSGAPRVALIQD